MIIHCKLRLGVENDEPNRLALSAAAWNGDETLLTWLHGRGIKESQEIGELFLED